MFVAVFSASLLVGLALQPLLIPWLRRRGVMDVPNERSSHVTATPRGGGIAVVTALGVGLLVGHHGGWDVLVVYLGAIALGVVGLVDDLRSLRAIIRLVAMVLVGGLGGLLLDSPLALPLAVPLMAAWTASYVNAFNFMDGINGISGLTGLVAGASYALMGYSFGSAALVAIGAALMAACLSFLPFNLTHPRVFLGDVGSYSLGFTIAALAWIAWAAGAPLLLSLAPTSVYLLDTGTTLVRRSKAGLPLTEAHRSHIYQRLATQSGRHLPVAFFVAASTVAVVAMAWIGYLTNLPVLGGLGVLILLTGYYFSVDFASR